MSYWLNNQGVNDTRSIDRSKVRLLCYGVQRSASTWVYQIACAVAGSGVLKTHDYLDLPASVPVLASYRDLRDCVISHWRFRYPDEVRDTAGQIPLERMFELAGAYTRAGWVFDQYARYRNPRMLRYREIMASPDRVFDAIEQATGSVVDRVRRQEILDTYSHRANREISDGTRPVDPSLMITPGHVHDGVVGSWRSFVPQDRHGLLTELLQPWLRDHGFND